MKPYFLKKKIIPQRSGLEKLTLGLLFIALFYEVYRMIQLFLDQGNEDTIPRNERETTAITTPLQTWASGLAGVSKELVTGMCLQVTGTNLQHCSATETLNPFTALISGGQYTVHTSASKGVDDLNLPFSLMKKIDKNYPRHHEQLFVVKFSKSIFINRENVPLNPVIQNELRNQDLILSLAKKQRQFILPEFLITDPGAIQSLTLKIKSSSTSTEIPVCIKIQLRAEKTLGDWTSGNDGIQKSPEQLLTLFRQLKNQLIILRRHKLVIWDIKLENLAVVEKNKRYPNGHLAIIDSSLAYNFNGKQSENRVSILNDPQGSTFRQVLERENGNFVLTLCQGLKNLGRPQTREGQISLLSLATQLGERASEKDYNRGLEKVMSTLSIMFNS